MAIVAGYALQHRIGALAVDDPSLPPPPLIWSSPSPSVSVSNHTLGWDVGSNPFTSSHLRLIDRDGAAVLQIDRDGNGASYGCRDLIHFSGISASALTREKLEGFDLRAGLRQGAGPNEIGWDYQALA